MWPFQMDLIANVSVLLSGNSKLDGSWGVEHVPPCRLFHRLWAGDGRYYAVASASK
jgi:hypothetical protein